MKQRFTASNRLLAAGLAALFGVIVWQAATLPLSAAEAEAWTRFVQPRLAALLTAPGAWSGLVYGILAKRTVGLFRLSEFSLRLPDVLAGAAYLGSFGRFASFPTGWAGGMASKELGSFGKSLAWRCLLVAAAAVPVFLHCFGVAGGLGIGLGLGAIAVAFPDQAGVWLGLALAAAPQFGFVWALAAAGLTMRKGFWAGMNQVVVPAVALAFVILIIPLSRGGPPAPLRLAANPVDGACRTAAELLSSRTGTGPVSIAAGNGVRPMLEFYRERYRRRNWRLDGPAPDYFLWLESAPPANLPRLASTVFHQDGVVLAQ